jgi:hypothetical protein
MKSTLKTLALVVAGITLCVPSRGSLSYTGNFAQDDNQSVFDFTLASATPVTLRTWSFAGGTNANGMAISPGGFAPVLSLFDAGGEQDLLALDHDGGPGSCGPRAVDIVSGFCWDAYLNLSLVAGSYILVLTEDDNTPNGPTLADGFLRDGQGNFTAGLFGGAPGSAFILADGSQRTNMWAVDLIGVDSQASAPEPGTTAMLVLGIAMLVSRRRFYCCQSEYQEQTIKHRTP